MDSRKEGSPNREAEPFVGRSSELRLLQQGLERAVGGAGVVFVVSGAAGIGKTALIREFLRRARDDERALSLVRGRCLEHYGPGEAYLPFLDGIGTLLVGPGREIVKPLLENHAPTWCPHFSGLDVPDAVREQAVGAGPERMMREMGDVWEVTSASIPMVALMEDLHWADPSSLDLIRHLATRIERQRVLLAITVREDDATAARVTSCLQQIQSLSCAQRLSLGPLSAGEVESYVDAAFDPHELPHELSRSCFRRTEGNPLFLKKLLAHLAERGDLLRDRGRWRLTQPLSVVDQLVPDDLRSMVELKIASLEEEDVRILRVASVLGREFSSPVLAGLLETEELRLEERLNAVTRHHGLVRVLGEEELPDGSLATQYRFVHSLYQEVLYEGLVSKKKLQVHRSAARELERRFASGGRGISAQLALHCERGRDFEAAVGHLLRAARGAARLFAYDEADRYLRHAQSLLERLPESARTAASLTVQQQSGALQVATGRFDEAAATFAEMLVEARGVDDVGAECAALNGACWALFFGRRMDEMAVSAYEGVVAAARSGQEALRAEAQTAIALVLIENGGRLRESIPLLDEVLETARRLDHVAALLPALTYRGFVHYWQSEYAQATERLAEGQALAAKLGDNFQLLICQTFLGYASANQGHLSRALTILESARSQAERNRERFWLPRLVSALAYVHRELEDFTAAVSLESEALDLAHTGGDSEAASSLLLGLAATQVRCGDLDAAGAALERLSSSPADPRWLAWNHEIRLQSALAEYHLARGQTDAADTATRRLMETAGEHGAAAYVVMGHAFAAHVAQSRGDGAAARAHVREAQEGVRAHSAPLAGWRTLAHLAAVLSADGDRAAGESAWREAAEVVQQVAGGIDDSALRRRFLESPSVVEVRERAGVGGIAP